MIKEGTKVKLIRGDRDRVGCIYTVQDIQVDGCCRFVGGGESCYGHVCEINPALKPESHGDGYNYIIVETPMRIVDRTSRGIGRGSLFNMVLDSRPSPETYTGKKCKCEKCGWEGTLDQHEEIIAVYDIAFLSGWAGHEFVCPQPDCDGAIGRNVMIRS
jgi:hypothetical protein